MTVLVSGSVYAQVPASSASPPVIQGKPFLVVTTDDAERLVADWQKPGAGAHLRVSDKIIRGKPITAFTFVASCKAELGRCSVTADIQVITPDHRSTMEQSGVIILDGPAPPRGQMIMSPAEVGITFDKDDLPGEYRLQYHITDNNARAVYDTEARFRLVE